MKELVAKYGKEDFIRTIVMFCTSKSALSYFETKLIFDEDALLKDSYLNKWLTAQINARNLKDYFIKD